MTTANPSTLSGRVSMGGSVLPFREPGETVTRPPLKSEIPVFHDRLGRDIDGNKIWRDDWNGTQPWFPLFLEWEAQYTHVNHHDWELSDSKWWHSEGVKTHYGIKNGVDLAQHYSESVDRRSFSGRILILPQPSFSLQTKITQSLFDTLPSQLDDYLPQPERDKPKENLEKLQFLSAPLSGFNNHLQTVEQGNHVKPSVRAPVSGTMGFLDEAQRPNAGFTLQRLKTMGIETDVTPYGAAKKSISGPAGPSSFKPVIHGQVRLNRVNIVDKFGQVVHLLDPTPVPDDALPEEQLCIFGAIVDPFSPVHAYSGILPVKELVLPNWTWQSAMDKMSAFFHIGPVSVTGDVPDFVESKRLVKGQLPPRLVPKEKGETGVLLPGGALGRWTWLQPYMDDGNPTAEQDARRVDGGNGRLEKFMPLAVDPVDEASRLERGPYTALEGYLQMASGAAKRPMTAELRALRY